MAVLSTLHSTSGGELLRCSTLRVTLRDMKKTSLYLDETHVERLRHLSEREGRSQAEIVRDAIDAYEVKRQPDRRFALTASGAGDGRSAGDIPEEELLEGFGS